VFSHDDLEDYRLLNCDATKIHSSMSHKLFLLITKCVKFGRQILGLYVQERRYTNKCKDYRIVVSNLKGQHLHTYGFTG